MSTATAPVAPPAPAPAPAGDPYTECLAAELALIRLLQRQGATTQVPA